MFSIRKKIEDFKNSKKFNAENCFKQQVMVENQNLSKRIEEITARIDYVVKSTISEHTVIYRVPEHEQKMFSAIKDYFTSLGFNVINLTIPELNNDEYMIISWKKFP